MRGALLLAAAAAALSGADARSLRSNEKYPLPDVPVTAPAGCSPGMRWVNYYNSPDQIVISWTTSCSTSDSYVAIGTTPALGTKIAAPTPVTYEFVTYTSPYIYHVVVSNLTLNTRYYYSVGGPTSGYSEIANFTSHPGVGPSTNYNLTFAIIGDLGQTENSQDTVNHIAASNTVTSVIHVGDLSYADDYEPRWDSWQTLVDPLSSHIPWMVEVGNHEVESFAGVPTTFLAYSTRWRMPALSNGSTELYYSFNIGPVHWVMASSYSPFTAGSAQYEWLQADLAAVDRTVTPWVFLGTHAPWYNSNTAHQQEGEAMRVAVEPLIYGAGVDACFFGHVHAYERNHRVYNYKRDPKGPYHITIGDGGNREGLASKWLAQPSYSAFRMASYGHGELAVVNSTCASWTWHQNTDAEPVIADQLWICKGNDI